VASLASDFALKSALIVEICGRKGFSSALLCVLCVLCGSRFGFQLLALLASDFWLPLPKGSGIKTLVTIPDKKSLDFCSVV
jgi:hypothetical protein